MRAYKQATMPSERRTSSTGGKVGWEFDFVGQGSVAGGVLSGTGLISDPFGAFGGTATDSNVTFKGTAAPDAVNVGR